MQIPLRAPAPGADVYALYGGPPAAGGTASAAAPAGYDRPVGYHATPSAAAAPHDIEAGPSHVANHPPRPGADVHHAHVSAAEEKWNKDIRRAFTRKVLGIVFCQLLVTTGIAFLFYQVKPIKDYVTSNQWVFWVSWVTALGLIITMSCSNRVRRKFPLNFVFLMLFTLVFSVLAATITARYNVRAIGLALAVTSGTVLGAFCVAAFTKLDLTRFGGFLFAVLMGVIVMSIVGVFWRNTVLQFVIAIVAAVLFTAYLIYDLQMLMGGGARELSPDEYIFASVNIYLDIVQIFLNVLQIFGLVQS